MRAFVAVLMAVLFAFPSCLPGVAAWAAGDAKAPVLRVEQELQNVGTGASGAFAPGDVAWLRVKVENEGAAVAEQVRISNSLALEFRRMTDGDDLEELAAVADGDGSVAYARLEPGEALFAYFSLAIPDAQEEGGARDAQDAQEADASGADGTTGAHGSADGVGALSNVASATCRGLGFTVESERLEIVLAARGGAPGEGDGGGAGGSDDGQEPAPDPDVPRIVDFEAGWIDAQGRFNAAARSAGSIVDYYAWEPGETVQLAARVTWSDLSTALCGTTAAQTWAAYSAADDAIATVDETGLVVPAGGSGIIVVTVTGFTDAPLEEGLALKRTLSVYFEGDRRDSIRVFRGDGDAAGEEITWYGSSSWLGFSRRGSAAAQGVWAQIERDGEVLSSRDGTGAFSFSVEETEIAGCAFDERGLCYVWADARGYDGFTFLMVSIELDGECLVRYVPIFVAAGEEGAGEGVVPDALTISVSWEDDPNPSDPARTEYTYTLRELDEMSSEYHAYTIVGDPDSVRRYAYQTARGVRLVALLNDCGIYEQDVKYLALKATDELSVNSALMGMDFFLKPRSYYPLFWQDRKTEQAQVVPAMIAVASRTFWNASAETVAGEVDTFAGLSGTSGSAPRLCIGAGGTAVTGGRYSVRNVERIYVTLAGAPPENPYVDPEPRPSSGGAGEGGSSGEGSGTSHEAGEAAAGYGTSARAGFALEGDAGPDGGGVLDAAPAERNGGDPIDDGANSLQVEDAGGAYAEPWRVWQMMSTAKTEAAISELVNPWEAWAPLMAAMMVAGGALCCLVWYRREKAPCTMRGKVAGHDGGM